MKELTNFLFQMKSMVMEITLEPIGVPDLHLKSQNVLQSQEVFLIDAKSNFLDFEDRSNIHQIVSFLKDKSIGVLKTIYGHHHPCIRKALSGTSQFQYFLYNYIASGHLIH